MKHRDKRRIQGQQNDLFDVLSDRPTWPDFPTEAQRTVTELVARMLKHQRHQEAKNTTQEVEHE